MPKPTIAIEAIKHSSTNF